MTNSPNGQRNAIELKVVLGVADASSKSNLNAKIAELEKKLNEVKIDIKIDPKAIAALEKLGTIDFSKLTESLGEATQKTKKFATATAAEVESAMKKASEAVGVSLGNAIKGSAADIKFLTKQLEGTNAVIDIKYDTVNGAKQLKAFQTSIEKDGVTKKVTFEQVMVSGQSESEFLWMPKIFQDTDRQLANAAKNTDELIARMKKLQTEGKITDKQFDELSNSISGVNNKTGFNNINQKMIEMVASTKKVNDNLAERERIEKQLVANQQKLQTQILSAEKAMKSNPTLGGSKEANDLVASYQKLNPASKNFKENLFDVNTQFTKMKTEASGAAKSSMGLLGSFQEAMKKFPIDFQVGLKLFELLETP